MFQEHAMFSNKQANILLNEFLHLHILLHYFLLKSLLISLKLIQFVFQLFFLALLFL